MSGFGLTDEETAFLVANVRPADRCWEWGSGESTTVLSKHCKYVTTVEHIASYAVDVVAWAGAAGQAGSGRRRNVSVIYAPPDLPYIEGTDDDGDLSTFRTYVESYTGRGIDVVLVDGRSRVECCRWLNERAPFGPRPELRVFLHDCDRESYAPIFEMFTEESRVGRLALLRMRLA